MIGPRYRTIVSCDKNIQRICGELVGICFFVGKPTDFSSLIEKKDFHISSYTDKKSKNTFSSE